MRVVATVPTMNTQEEFIYRRMLQIAVENYRYQKKQGNIIWANEWLEKSKILRGILTGYAQRLRDFGNGVRGGNTQKRYDEKACEIEEFIVAQFQGIELAEMGEIT